MSDRVFSGGDFVRVRDWDDMANEFGEDMFCHQRRSPATFSFF